MAATFKYPTTNEAPIFETLVNGAGKKVINKVLMGTYITVTAEDAAFYKVKAFSKEGWMKKTDLSDNMGLNINFGMVPITSTGLNFRRCN